MGPKKPRAYDQRLGIARPPTKDEIHGCNERGSPLYLPNIADFEKVWCSQCKNTECVRSQGGKMPWVHRMQMQPEYLLYNPKFSDLSSEEHKALAAQDFALMNAKAERQEISDQREDWSIPEEGEKLIPGGLPTQETVLETTEKSVEPERDIPGSGSEEPKPRLPPPPVTANESAREASRPKNTPMPKGGLMVGSPTVQPPDPWAPTNRGTVVALGAKVVLK